MQPPGELYRCTTCGASLSLEQLRGTDCPYCKTVFPHHGRAAEQAALVNQVFAQQLAQQNPYGYGAPPQVPAAYGAPPPQVPGPYGGAPPMHPYPYANQAAQQWQGALKRSMTWMFVTIAIVVLVMFGVGIAVFVLAG